MLKFVVLAVVVVSVSAKPGYLGGGYPTAVSHVSRVDYHAKPVISAYSSPYSYSGLGYGGYGSAYGGSALGYGSSGFGHSAYGYGYPVAHSYANRVDLPGTPIAVGVSGYGHAGLYGGSGYGYGGWNY